MKTRAAATTAIVILSLVSSAYAEEPPVSSDHWYDRPVGEVHYARELTFTTGYTMGEGVVGPSANVRESTNGGAAIGVGLGKRTSDRLSLSLQGQFVALSPDGGRTIRGLDVGFGVGYHWRPDRFADPWVDIGPGYRFFWIQRDGAATTMSHGFQLIRARFGVDFRLSPTVAVAPVLGADINTLLWRDDARLSEEELRFSTFVFMGMQGRFDFLARRP